MGSFEAVTEITVTTMEITLWLFWASLSIMIYTYVGYPLILYALQVLLLRMRDAKEPAVLPTVSVILAAFNESKAIRRKIENCLDLQYPKDRIEIFVGSDGSSDDTVAIVQEFNDERIHIFDYPNRRGKMAVVNDLVRKSSGEICVFSDITEVFDQDAVRQLVHCFSDDSVGAVTGQHIYNPDNSAIGMVTRTYWRLRRALQTVESVLH